MTEAKPDSVGSYGSVISRAAYPELSQAVFGSKPETCQSVATENFHSHIDALKESLKRKKSHKPILMPDIRWVNPASIASEPVVQPMLGPISQLPILKMDWYAPAGVQHGKAGSGMSLTVERHQLNIQQST